MNIFIDIIAEMYGIRDIHTEITLPDGTKTKVMAEFDFNYVDYDAFDLKVNIGSSTYWSQLMQVQTMDSFFKNGVIDDAVIYLEHVPDGYITGKEELIAKLKEKKEKDEHAMSTEKGNPKPMGDLKKKVSGV